MIGPRDRISGGPAARRGAVALLVLLGVGCEGFLDVDHPGTLTQEDLDGPDGIRVMVSGAYSGLQAGLDDLVLYGGAFTDELDHVGRRGLLRFFDARAIPEGHGALLTAYAELSSARLLADLVIERTAGDPEGAGALRAEALLYAAFARALLADAFCLVTIDEGPPRTPDEVYQESEGLFGQAIEAAGETAAPDLMAAARVGRARVRLHLGDRAGAAADAETVPEDFVMALDYTSHSPREENVVHLWTIVLQEVSVGERFRNVAGVAQCSSDPDREVESCPFPTPAVGADGETPLYVPLQYPDEGSDIPLASGVEAALIAREARGEDVREERAVRLFLQGRRLPDGRRYGLWRAEDGQRCFPLPAREKQANPNCAGGACDDP